MNFCKIIHEHKKTASFDFSYIPTFRYKDSPTPTKAEFLNFSVALISNILPKNQYISTFNKDISKKIRTSFKTQKSSFLIGARITNWRHLKMEAQRNVKQYRTKLHHKNFNIFMLYLPYLSYNRKTLQNFLQISEKTEKKWLLLKIGLSFAGNIRLWRCYLFLIQVWGSGPEKQILKVWV